MDYVWLSDVARYYVVVAALWLSAIMLRLTCQRFCGSARTLRGRLHRLVRRQDSPHPFSTLGLALMMLIAILRRFDTLGQPGDIYLWLVVTAISLVLAGVLINVQFTLKPPWRRH